MLFPSLYWIEDYLFEKSCLGVFGKCLWNTVDGMSERSTVKRVFGERDVSIEFLTLSN